MQKIRSVCSCIVAAIIVILICPSPLAHNSCTDECHYIIPAAWENAYAWNQRYLFTAQGYFIEDQQEYQYTWGTPHYRICRVDRITGECTVLIEDYPYHAIDLILFEDDLYIFRQYNRGNEAMLKHMREDGSYDVRPVIGAGEKQGTFYLIKMDSSGKMQAETRFDFDHSIQDYVICGQRLYMALSDGIVYLDMETMDTTRLYTAEAEICNLNADNHMIIEDDVLYLQDGKAIVGIDIYTGEVYTKKRVLDPDVFWSFPYRRFDYLVLDHHLYYWNETTREMMVLNLENDQENAISKDRYFFVQPTREGIVVARIKEQYLQTIYDRADDTTWAYTAVNGADVPGCSEYLFFTFEDMEHPVFDPSMDTFTIMNDYMYSVVFLDQMQYVDDDLNIKTRKAEA